LTRGLASHFLADAVLCEEELRETEGPSEARDGVRRRRARAVYISGVAHTPEVSVEFDRASRPEGKGY
jgi:hypothetical protein